MLAAFGFFYNAVKDGIDEALELSTSPATKEEKRKTREKLKAARRTAVLLTFVAGIVCALLASQTVTEISAAIDVKFDIGQYSTLNAIFVAMAMAWLGITIFCLCRVSKLSSNLSKLGS
jgi:uncharacterized membrane protein YgcG